MIKFRVGWGVVDYTGEMKGDKHYREVPAPNTIIHSGSFILSDFNLKKAKMQATKKMKKCPEVEKIMAEFFPREYNAREKWWPWSDRAVELTTKEYSIQRTCHLKQSMSYSLKGGSVGRYRSLMVWLKIAWPKELGRADDQMPSAK